MSEYISVAALPLASLFSDRFRFHLPWFQRGYAWGEEHAGRLLTSARDAMEDDKSRYLFGRIWLAKKPDAPVAALIDGHQRTLTLTILFALLRDFATARQEELRRRLHALLFQEASRRSGAHFRFEPQQSVARFFADFVQGLGATQRDPQCDVMELPYPARKILQNRNHLRAMLADADVTEQNRADVAEFLMNRCSVIVAAVEDEDEAWDILATEENTGLDFHQSERAKYNLISVMAAEVQEQAGRSWERAQATLGPDDTAALLGHIRALKLKRRSSKPLETDLCEIFKLNQDGLTFMEREFAPRAELVNRIKQRTIGHASARAGIARSLDTLFWLGHQLWIAPVLRWLEIKGEADAQTGLFFRRLDCLAWFLRLAAVDLTQQEKRFTRLLKEIEGGTKVDGLRALAIDPKLKAAVLANLRSRTFYAKHSSGLVLRRLALLLGGDPGPIDGARVTIEHVAPRNPPRGRVWWRDFKSQQQINEHVNRLGNLVLLTPEDNHRVDTFDYAIKRPILIGSGFKLSEAAGQEEAAWTPATIVRRTEGLIGRLLAHWELDLDKAKSPALTEH